MCTDNGEVTNNNAESMNHATSARVRAQPVSAICRALLEQEVCARTTQTDEAGKWVQARLRVIPHANDTHRDEVQRAAHYGVRESG